MSDVKFERLTDREREWQLIIAVNAWEEHTNEELLLSPQQIFRHWRGRPSDESGGIITMLEAARMAWRASRTKELTFDELVREANRLLKLPPLKQSKFLAGSFELAKALANVVLAVACWRKSKRRDEAYGYLVTAAELYQSVWPIGFDEPLDIRDPLFAGIDPFEQPKSLNALLFGAFCPTRCQDFNPTPTTLLILQELLAHIMDYRLSGSKVEMKGLFLGDDPFNSQVDVGHVLDITVRRLTSPVTGFYPDPISLGVTRIHKKMRDSLRAAWRCYLFDERKADSAALRIDVRLNHPRVNVIRGESAGGLIAAMMCAARSQCPLLPNVSATCRLVLTQSQRSASYPDPLDPEQVRLGEVTGVIPKLREAYVGHSVDHVFMHKDNVLEWEQAGRPNPQALPVATLNELITKINRDQPLWEEVEHLRRIGEARWDDIIKHQGESKTDRDHHHRLHLYVPPSLRVEGPPIPMQLEPTETEPSAAKKQPQELLVPGEELSDQSLLQVLALCFKKEIEVDWLAWLDANIGEDQATVETDEEPKDDDEVEISARTEEVESDPMVMDRFRKQVAWLCPGRDLLVYDQAGAGKSVLTLRMAHLLNDAKHAESIFGVKLPTLVVRIEGEWPKTQQGVPVGLREMIFDRLLFQSQHPGTRQNRLLDEAGRDQLRKVIDLAITHQRIALIIDGFDQFGSDARQHIVEQHDTDDGRRCRWIIASRQHTISVLFGSSRRVNDWLRVRIEPFSERQRDCFFEKAGLADVWTQYVNPESMSELLKLPVVLDQLRDFIETKQKTDQKEGRQPEPVQFESYSQLALVTSRLSLDRALEPERLAELPPPEHLKNRSEQLEAVERVLSLIAFELLLQARGESDDRWNGFLLGQAQKQAFFKECKNRYYRKLDLDIFAIRKKHIPDIEDDRELEDLREHRAQAREAWDWSLKVLERVELHHRAYLEQNDQEVLAFRDRKSVEFYAARYLTRYATEWDVYAEYPDDQQGMQATDKVCAWQRIADPQWHATWLLAMHMPRQPLPSTSGYSFENAIIDPQATATSLSALFRQTLDGNRRPTELIWNCWPLFEYDYHRSLDDRYRFGSKIVSGQELVAAECAMELKELAHRTLLPEDIRRSCLEQYRRTSRELVEAIEQNLDTVLLDDGTRVKIPANEAERAEILQQWQRRSCEEKSLTLLQCPPQAWIEAFEHKSDDRGDPRVNSAIVGHSQEAIQPIYLQATPVTRGMFCQFDPHEDVALANRAYSLLHLPWKEFPAIEVSWYDAFCFAKWLGAHFRLPSELEWEHGARAGSTTVYCCGDILNPTLANYRCEKEASWEQGCCPAGFDRYSCNQYGLFDVHGNVSQWCADWNDNRGSSRSCRGGAWNNDAEFCSSANRGSGDPVRRYFDVGFRLCRE